MLYLLLLLCNLQKIYYKYLILNIDLAKKYILHFLIFKTK